MKDIKALDTDTLIAWLANAETTFGWALGHTKAERNRNMAAKYREELERRKADIPSCEELEEMGRYNGEGSS